MATMSALIIESGATSESTKDAMSLFASRRSSAFAAMGDAALSVIEMTFAPCFFA